LFFTKIGRKLEEDVEDFFTAKARGREGILIVGTRGNFHREDARAVWGEGILSGKTQGDFHREGGREF